MHYRHTIAVLANDFEIYAPMFDGSTIPIKGEYGQKVLWALQNAAEETIDRSGEDRDYHTKYRIDYDGEWHHQALANWLLENYASAEDFKPMLSFEELWEE